MRGSLSYHVRSLHHAGSIPACAGKPPMASTLIRATRVHPRVCGEAGADCSVADHPRGPSPRVRGSRLTPTPMASTLRSIPACAGKPSSQLGGKALPTVHPRVCGEADADGRASPGERGPSPRVRGSRLVVLVPSSATRSIPACAGKPEERRSRYDSATVHPRVCGEAVSRRRERRQHQGPSPRVRGSRPATCRRRMQQRSIPACAGKPGAA